MSFQEIKYVLVDLDGTVADCNHRLHFIKGSPKNYERFFDEIPNDKPIINVIEVIMALADQGYSIIFMSGRPDSHKQQSCDWINRNITLEGYHIYMRKAGDTRADDVVKEELLDAFLKEHNVRLDQIVGVFDDRPRVCAVWQKRGLTLFKVGDWHEEKEGRFKRVKRPKLHVMVGATGVGKSTFIAERLDHCVVVSTDNLRHLLLGDFKRQDENDAIFQAAHKLLKANLECGLDVVFDATNLRDADRKAVLKLAPQDCEIEYVVIHRREGLPLDWRWQALIDKHDQTFKSNLKTILKGDGDPRVQVVQIL